MLIAMAKGREFGKLHTGFKKQKNLLSYNLSTINLLLLNIQVYSY